jgi:hypothetical protein
MNSALIYWITGCIIVGVPMGSLLNDCPDARIDAVQVAASIATWPAIVLAAIVRDGSKITPHVCWHSTLTSG